MTFWEWLNRIGPGWPSERQWVTVGLFATFWAMLQMAVNDPGLWNIKLFEVVFQAIALTGILNMVVAFFYAANKGDEQRATNTGKMADAMKAVAENSPAGGPSGTKEDPLHIEGSGPKAEPVPTTTEETQP